MIMMKMLMIHKFAKIVEQQKLVNGGGKGGHYHQLSLVLMHRATANNKSVT